MNAKREAALRDAWEDQREWMESYRQHQVHLDEGWNYANVSAMRRALGEAPLIPDGERQQQPL